MAKTEEKINFDDEIKRVLGELSGVMSGTIPLSTFTQTAMLEMYMRYTLEVVYPKLSAKNKVESLLMYKQMEAKLEELTNKCPMTSGVDFGDPQGAVVLNLKLPPDTSKEGLVH